MLDRDPSLRSALAEDIARYAEDLRMFLEGALTPDAFKAMRTRRGVYEQRRDGTYMLRVRIPAGALDSSQARCIAALGCEFGNGVLHVTTRQDIQLHDVALADTPRIMRRLLDADLGCMGGGGNGVRNVTACPYAGVCPAEHFDVTPFAVRITDHLVGTADRGDLPRKFKIGVSGCAADCTWARVADAGFVAQVRDGAPGFRVYAGGGMGARSRAADVLLEWAPAADVLRIAETVRRLFHRVGDRANRNRARLRFAVERIGPDAFKEAFRDELAGVAREGIPDSGAPAAWVAQPAEARTPNEHDTQLCGGLRVIRQRGAGLVAVPLRIPLGDVRADDLAAIADIAEVFSAERGVRTTRGQRLVVRSVREEDCASLAARLRTLQADVIGPSALERFVACTGAATCRLGLCRSRAAARACARCLDAENAVAGDIAFQISGCPNACGLHPSAHIGFFGVLPRISEHPVPSYRVVVGGRSGSEGAILAHAAGTVPARSLPDLVARIAHEFRTGRKVGENFATWVERCGTNFFSTLVEVHAGAPAHAWELSRDWGDEEDR